MDNKLYVVYSDGAGVYLGVTFTGRQIWSMRDSYTAEVEKSNRKAPCFASREEALRYMEVSWEKSVVDWGLVEVAPDSYRAASSAACNRAGLPSW